MSFVKLNGTTKMQSPFCLKICGMGFLLRFISSYMQFFTAKPNSYTPVPDTIFVVGKSFYITSILIIYRCWDIAKIFPSIIRAFTIYMINGILRPFASHVQPCKTMGWIVFTIDAYRNISLFIQASHLFSDYYRTRCFYLPNKNPSIFIVVTNLLKSFLNDFGFHIFETRNFYANR